MNSSSGICDSVQAQLEIYSDGELSLSDRQELESHLEVCETCSDINQRLLLLKGTLRNGLSSSSPVGLKRIIRQNLRQLTDDNVREHLSLTRWLGILGGIASVAMLLVWLVVLTPVVQTLALEKQAVAAHIRSLQVDHLSDITSSDQHAVKPWFSGKLNFSPQILKFSPQAYPLTGGRLEYFNGKNVAAIVYKRRKHTINLFIWPAAKTKTTVRTSVHYHNGYNLLAWNYKGMNYWLVSDLNLKELKLFSEMIKSKL